MRMLVCATAALLLPIGERALSAPPAQGTAPAGNEKLDDPAAEIAGQAVDLIRAKRALEALALLDKGIADQDKAHAGETHLLYSAHSPTQVLLYATQGAKEKKDVTVLGPGWSDLLFLKGFALIDLGRSDEAKAYLERAIALSPMHSQYLSEMGEWYKSHEDWERAHQFYQKAYDFAGFAPENGQLKEKTRALRGMGYVLTEQGKLKEAERAYRDCLKLDSRDEIAKGELTYVRGLQAKSRAN
jgi:tetratricopeptide (TPR) repeat protein